MIEVSPMRHMSRTFDEMTILNDGPLQKSELTQHIGTNGVTNDEFDEDFSPIEPETEIPIRTGGFRNENGWSPVVDSDEDKIDIDDLETCKERARKHQWIVPQPYDYEADSASYGDERNWFSKAKRYEWKDSYGDIAPEDEDLEAELFHNNYSTIQGEHMAEYSEFPIELQGDIQVSPVRSFADAGLHPLILDNIKKSGYGEPTPVQCYTIPAILQGYDVNAIAQAGSGKTGAYMIPILSKLAGKCLKLAAKRPGIGLPIDTKTRAQPLVLVLAPTRELVNQIFDHSRRFCYRTMLRPCVAYGGGSVGAQAEELHRGCDILIATVGRLKDFVYRPDLLSLERLRYIVFDEADELMDGDWAEDLNAILSASRFKSSVQTMMFSATFSDEAKAAAARYTRADNCVRIEVGRVGSTHRNITQVLKWVNEDRKLAATYDLLFSLLPARTLIFVNTKRKAEELDDFLYNRGLPCTSIHADRNQSEREDSVIAFRTGKSPILVTTAVSARGIDVKSVHHVINYDLPSSQGGIDEYVHRIGRTGRIGNEGLATSFFNDRNHDIGNDLVKLLIEAKQPVPKFLVEHIPEYYQVEFQEDEEERFIASMATPQVAAVEVDEDFKDDYAELN